MKLDFIRQEPKFTNFLKRSYPKSEHDFLFSEEVSYANLLDFIRDDKGNEWEIVMVAIEYALRLAGPLHADLDFLKKSHNKLGWPKGK